MSNNAMRRRDCPTEEMQQQTQQSLHHDNKRRLELVQSHRRVVEVDNGDDHHPLMTVATAAAAATASEHKRRRRQSIENDDEPPVSSTRSCLDGDNSDDEEHSFHEENADQISHSIVKDQQDDDNSNDVCPTSSSSSKQLPCKAPLGDINNEIYHIRAYRMTSTHRLRLCIHLFPYMSEESRQRNDVCLRIGAALRYFAGGNPTEIAQQYKCTLNELMAHILEVVHAVNQCPAFDISFPESHEEQREIAACFELIKSDIGLSNCAGALGSMLVWTDQPNNNNNKDDNKLKASREHPHFCQAKNKFGFNMQAVCDHNGRFLHVSVDHPGSTNNNEAFADSDLYQRITSDPQFLAPNLALYSNEYYPNVSWIKKPYLDQEMNFYHAQLCCQIVFAFSNLVQRWALLRQPLPESLGVDGQRALALALCKLQNFCLLDKEPMMPLLPTDLIAGYQRGAIVLDEYSVPHDLLGGGDHF